MLNMLDVATVPNSTVDFSFGYDQAREAANYIVAKATIQPEILLIAGSGMGYVAELIDDPITMDYKDIPHFPLSTAPGHEGKLVLGKIHGRSVACMQGRFHYYEGYSLQKITFPIKVFFLLGVSLLIASTASGALNRDYNVGDIMIFNDHVDLLGMVGESALRGPNDDRFGERFPPMRDIYGKELRDLGVEAAMLSGLENTTREGVFVVKGGPAYSTAAETRILQLFGGDATSMSTVPEVVVAKYCNMSIFAFGLITDKPKLDADGAVKGKGDDILDVVKRKKKDVKNFIGHFISGLKNVKN